MDVALESRRTVTRKPGGENASDVFAVAARPAILLVGVGGAELQ